MKALRDPYRRSLLVAGCAAVGGVVAFVVAYLGVSRTVDLADQVSFVVSGGFGGITVLGVGLALLLVQSSRHAAAVERRDLAAATSEFRSIAEALVARNRPTTETPAELSVTERQRRRRARR